MYITWSDILRSLDGLDEATKQKQWEKIGLSMCNGCNMDDPDCESRIVEALGKFSDDSSKLVALHVVAAELCDLSDAKKEKILAVFDEDSPKQVACQMMKSPCVLEDSSLDKLCKELAALYSIPRAYGEAQRAHAVDGMIQAIDQFINGKGSREEDSLSSSVIPCQRIQLTVSMLRKIFTFLFPDRTQLLVLKSLEGKIEHGISPQFALKFLTPGYGKRADQWQLDALEILATYMTHDGLEATVTHWSGQRTQIKNWHSKYQQRRTDEPFAG